MDLCWTTSKFGFVTIFTQYIFVVSLSKMQESGQISRIWNRWKNKRVEGCLGDGQDALEMGTVAAVFVILGSAAGVSLVLLLGELLSR